MDAELRKIGDYIKSIEAENQKLKKSINMLLQEDEIKTLPSYQLLTDVYKYPLDEAKKTQKSSIINPFNSIYAPSRARNKTSITIKRKEQQTKEKKKEQKNEEEDMKTALFNDSPVEEKKKEKGEGKKQPIPPLEKRITVNPVGESLIVEFSGIQYIFNNLKIYQRSDGKKVGYIRENGIFIKDVEVRLKKLSLEPLGDYYQCKDNVFKKLTASIGYRIGELKDGEIHAWLT